MVTSILKYVVCFKDKKLTHVTFRDQFTSQYTKYLSSKDIHVIDRQDGQFLSAELGIRFLRDYNVHCEK